MNGQQTIGCCWLLEEAFLCLVQWLRGGLINIHCNVVTMNQMAINHGEVNCASNTGKQALATHKALTSEDAVASTRAETRWK